MCLLKFCANSIGRSVDIFLPLPGRLVYFSHLCVKLPMVWGLYFITGARINVYVPVRLVRGVPSVIASGKLDRGMFCDRLSTIQTVI